MILYLHHKETPVRIAESNTWLHRYLLTSDPEGKKTATTFPHSHDRCQACLDTIDHWARAMNIRIANREQYWLGKETRE